MRDIAKDNRIDPDKLFNMDLSGIFLLVEFKR